MNKLGVKKPFIRLNCAERFFIYISSRMDGSMVGDSMVDRTERMDRMGRMDNMGIDNVDVFFYDVSHNCHNHIHSHHHIYLCHIDHNNRA